MEFDSESNACPKFDVFCPEVFQIFDVLLHKGRNFTFLLHCKTEKCVGMDLAILSCLLAVELKEPYFNILKSSVLTRTKMLFST